MKVSMHEASRKLLSASIYLRSAISKKVSFDVTLLLLIRIPRIQNESQWNILRSFSGSPSHWTRTIRFAEIRWKHFSICVSDLLDLVSLSCVWAEENFHFYDDPKKNAFDWPSSTRRIQHKSKKKPTNFLFVSIVRSFSRHNLAGDFTLQGFQTNNGISFCGFLTLHKFHLSCVAGVIYAWGRKSTQHSKAHKATHFNAVKLSLQMTHRASEDLKFILHLEEGKSFLWEKRFPVRVAQNFSLHMKRKLPSCLH